jgi:hypothetical protein
VKDLAERLASCDPQALVVLVDTDGLPVRAGKVTEGFYSADYDEFALDDVNKDDPDFGQAESLVIGSVSKQLR